MRHCVVMINDKILDQFALKAFAYDKINVTEKYRIYLGWLENIVGKGEILVTSIFFCSRKVFKRLPSLGP